ncbi:hypothetical protein ACEZ3G_11365 [Maribacter algicola]|uniref:Uncharacterized protein n=1 Tax=Meishania litoralis TaxID=3434685 RepID=A0ACC7LJV7_9FLAO
MRNLVLLFTALILGTSGVMASGTTNEDKVATRNAYRYNNSFIFVESGITFSVYPDGEFDFYIDNYVNGRRNKITFNSGFDYSPYAQYDDYGAVIQVENVPIYYDYYGRVNQIGNVDIAYRNGRVFRMGGMYVYYNNRGFYDYHTGYINVYNRYYVYRPFHRWFVRPAIGFCLVFDHPYRRYYNPFRYTYYRPYLNNRRWAYAKIGREYRYNKVRRERATVYRNDKRVAVRENNTRRGAVARSNRTVESRSNTARNSNISRNSQSVERNVAVRSNRSRSKIAGRTAVDRSQRIESRSNDKGNVRSNSRKTVTKRSTAVNTPRRSAVGKRTVVRTPTSREVTRNANTYRKPQSSSRSQSVGKAPARSRSTVARSTGSRSRTSKAISSRSGGKNARSATVRSSRRQ